MVMLVVQGGGCIMPMPTAPATLDRETIRVRPHSRCHVRLDIKKVEACCYRYRWIVDQAHQREKTADYFAHAPTVTNAFRCGP